MVVAVIALMGAFLDISGPGLAQETAPAAWSAQAMSGADLASLTPGGGSLTISVQELSGISTGLSLVQSGGGSNILRTGDIALDGGGSTGFAGFQAISVNTGVASVSQSAVSIAAGAIMIGPPGSSAPQ